MYASRKIGTLQETIALLNCRRLPARLNVTEAAVILGFQEHDMPVLIAKKVPFTAGETSPQFADILCGGGNIRNGRGS